MAIFQTEFKVKSSLKAEEFDDIVIEWIQGMQSTELAEKVSELSSAPESWSAIGEGNESLLYRRVKKNDGLIVGVRHELPDDQGRIWRTEVVFRHISGAAAVGVKAQCLTKDFAARVRAPKRPYIIKLMLRDAWPNQSSHFQVNDVPAYISEGDIERIVESLCGRGDHRLPVVYVSRNDDNRLALDVEKLAYDLGGLAHVVVEPSRAVSFKLMSMTQHRNPYGGTVGVAVASVGLIRRFYIGGAIADENDLGKAVISFLVEIVSACDFVLGADWQTLQEIQTEVARNQVTSTKDAAVDEYLKAFDQENKELKELVELLSFELNELKMHAASSLTGGADGTLSTGSVPELYPGEVKDRLRVAVEAALSGSKVTSERTVYLLKTLLGLFPFTGGAKSLIEQIKAAGRDSTEMPSRMGYLLTSLGFSRRVEGKHTVYSPPSELGGLGSVTISKTPGDYRSGMNMAADVTKSLALQEVNHDSSRI